MQIDHLRYFIALSNFDSINKASYALNTTPQNISRILKSLEKEVETNLFCRTAKGITLTQEGTIFLQFAKTTIYQFDKMQSNIKFKQTHHNRSQRITIFSSNAINEIILNNILIAFSQEYPHVIVNNILVDWKEGYEKLTKTSSDSLAFLFFSPEENFLKNFDIVPIVHTFNIAIMSKTHPLAQNNQISCKQLADQKLIIHARNSIYNTASYKFLKPYLSSKSLTFMMSSGSLDACYLMVAASEYIFPSTLKSFLRQDEKIKKNVIAIPFLDYPVSTYALIKHKNASLDSTENLLFTFILDYLQKAAI